MRQDMIARGMSFLLNPKVAAIELSKRIKFLKAKGCTPQELSEIVARYKSVSQGSKSVALAISTLRAQMQPEAERAAIQATIAVLEHTLHERRKEEESARRAARAEAQALDTPRDGEGSPQAAAADDRMDADHVS